MVAELIGLSGFARAGKDEAAAVLVEEFGFVQVAFADKLREMIYALNPIIDSTLYGLRADGRYGVDDWEVPVYLQEAIDQFGWSGYKETPYGDEIRRLLQRLGTEAGRQTLWDTIWIDAALTGLPEDANVVVSDGRFFNEFDAVRDRGGSIWRIERTGVGPANDHASETEAAGYQNFSKVLLNDSTLEEYRDKVRVAAFESGDTAKCFVHDIRLTATSRGTWRCADCLSEAGKKAASARWGRMENDL